MAELLKQIENSAWNLSLSAQFEQNKPDNFQEVVSKYPESTSLPISTGKGWREVIDNMTDEEKVLYTWKPGEEIMNLKNLSNRK